MLAQPPPSRGRRTPWFELLLAVLASCILFFVVAPLVGLLFASSPAELRGAIVDPEVTGSIGLTLAAALVATLVCTLAGIPLAYLLARKRFFGRSAVLALVDLPIVIPHSAAGVALLTVIGRRSLLGHVTGGLTGTFAGIAVAMAFVSLPFLVNAARDGFTAVPERLERAARSLGAPPWKAFFTIPLPMARGSIVSGMVMMWARGISEFGAVIIIAYHPMTTPVLIFQRFNDFGLPYARSAAVLLILICVAIFVALHVLVRERKRGLRHA